MSDLLLLWSPFNGGYAGRIRTPLVEDAIMTIPLTHVYIIAETFLSGEHRVTGARLILVSSVCIVAYFYDTCNLTRRNIYVLFLWHMSYIARVRDVNKNFLNSASDITDESVVRARTVLQESQSVKFSLAPADARIYSALSLLLELKWLH